MRGPGWERALAERVVRGGRRARGPSRTARASPPYNRRLMHGSSWRRRTALAILSILLASVVFSAAVPLSPAAAAPASPTSAAAARPDRTADTAVLANG